MSGIDICSTCLTVDEYRALSAWRRILWRAMVHPVVLLLVLPPLVLLVIFRLPLDAPRSWMRERRAVLATNRALLSGCGVSL
jgi:omega-6 fatty acid desaturase (delta-12 desaturase)